MCVCVLCGSEERYKQSERERVRERVTKRKKAIIIDKESSQGEEERRVVIESEKAGDLC